jgi:hypothetical protein
MTAHLREEGTRKTEDRQRPDLSDPSLLATREGGDDRIVW